MAETPGIKYLEVRTADRHGSGAYSQSSDGTGAAGNLAAFTTDVSSPGTLTDGGPNLFCVVAIFPGKPTASAQIEAVIPGNLPHGVIFPANFQFSGGYVKTPPAAAVTFIVNRSQAGGAGLQIGTVTLSTTGVFTFATSAGSAISFASFVAPALPDTFIVVAPSTPDANMSDVSMTFYGKR